MQPFLASRLKIGRAAQHVAILRGEVAAWMARRPIYLLVEPHPDSPEMIAWAIRIAESVPPTWSPIIGDIVHNLRSSLDLMACDVVRLGGGAEDGEGIYFPFSKNADELDAMIERRMPGASPEAHDMVRQLKPYPGGNAVLRGIHELDIIDKHRALLPTVGWIKSPAGGVMPASLIAPHVPLSGFRAASPDMKIGVSAVDFSLVFPNNGPFEGRELLPTLENLIQDFAGVVDAFEALCLGTIVEPLTDIMSLRMFEEITGLPEGAFGTRIQT